MHNAEQTITLEKAEEFKACPIVAGLKEELVKSRKAAKELHALVDGLLDEELKTSGWSFCDEYTGEAITSHKELYNADPEEGFTAWDARVEEIYKKNGLYLGDGKCPALVEDDRVHELETSLIERAGEFFGIDSRAASRRLKTRQKMLSLLESTWT